MIIHLALYAITGLVGIGLMLLAGNILYTELLHSTFNYPERIGFICLFSAIELVMMVGLYFLWTDFIPQL